MSSNSPGGQTVPYGPSFTETPFDREYSKRQPPPDSQYQPAYHIPPPSQSHPWVHPQVEDIIRELEEMKMENEEKEAQRIARRVEKRKKKKKKEKRADLAETTGGKTGGSESK